MAKSLDQKGRAVCVGLRSSWYTVIVSLPFHPILKLLGLGGLL